MTKSKLHNALLAVTMAGGLFAVAGSAYATPLTPFTAREALSFDVGSERDISGGTFASVTADVLEWREGDTPTSFLNIIGPSNTDVVITSDTGLWTDVGQVQHDNNVIPGGSFSYTIDFISSFKLTGATFDATGNDTLGPVTLDLSFLETANTPPCVESANLVGSICDDQFTIPDIDELFGTFLFTTANGEKWELELRLLANTDLGTAFDDANNIIYTAENADSEILIQARINQVPEPATLALLGIGLMGLPLARRRATKKA